jgi:hypothetical protein
VLSNARAVTTPKYYLFDPCVAVAILNTNATDLLLSDSKLLSNNRSNHDDA